MPPRLTREEVIALFDKLNNQGRWGKDDERGILSLTKSAQPPRAWCKAAKWYRSHCRSRRRPHPTIRRPLRT
jgi:hypothetical protein